MPFSSGSFSLAAGNPVVTGTTISSTWANNTLSDIATGLSTCVLKDGSQTITANIPMSGFKFTGLGAGTSANDSVRLTQAQGAAYLTATAVAGTNTITGTLTPAITAYAAGQFVYFVPANTNTGATTAQWGGVGSAQNVFWNGAACVGGELRQNIPALLYHDGTQYHIVGNGFNAPFSDAHAVVEGSADATKKLRFEVDGLTTATTRVVTWPDASFTVPYTGSAGADVTSGVVTVPLRSYLSGCTMSTAGGSATMSIAAGQCTDSTNVNAMVLAAIAKTTSAWAVGTGNGGLDTGAIANATWYHFFVIKRTDTGVVDVLISLSPSSPTMPANYTLFRRIGSGLTNGSAQWVAFTQDGDFFQWSVPVLESTSANPGTAAVTQTLANVPTGVNVRAFMNIVLGGAGNASVYVSDLATTDAAPAQNTAPGLIVGLSNTGVQITVRTNTSAQIRTRLDTSGGGQHLRPTTLGWFDTRGRDN